MDFFFRKTICVKLEYISSASETVTVFIIRVNNQHGGERRLGADLLLAISCW